MKRSCPSLQELLAFDAVARHESLTGAAGALCITVSAVSKQVAGLQSFLGRPVVEKHGRGVRLTPLGRTYWQQISAGLRQIEAATFEARAGQAGAGVLVLASAPTFLTKWLIPRLPDFRRRCPDVTLSFSRHLDVHESIPPEVHGAIRYGGGDWPGASADYLAGREFIPVAAPALLRARPAQRPQEVAGHTLLHHEQAPAAWRAWSLHHGVGEAGLLAGPRFAQYSALIQAAASGLGIGLVPQVLVQEELADGSLTVPCGEPVAIDLGHHLCFRPDRLETPVFRAFRAWILEQAATGRGAARPAEADVPALTPDPGAATVVNLFS